MGCSHLRTLEDAMRSGWKMCKYCHLAICSFCYQHLGPNPLCLSYKCSDKKRPLEAIPLPIDKIIIFAQEAYQADYREGLLYNLFYRESEKRYAPPFFVVREKKDTVAPAEEQRPTKIQEEVWKNFQLVITKRRGGKFITWERVV
jgi:hypothetical protein